MAEIFVVAGIFALVAAIVGGGLSGGGWEIKALKSRTRQIMLGILGLVLIGVGAAISSGYNPFASGPSASASIVQGVDFRSSQVSDSFLPGGNRGYLIIATTIRVRNSPESGRDVTWETTDASLRIGDRSIPFHSYYFFSGRLTRENWLGERRVSAEPIAVPPGQSIQRDIIFMPENAGPGGYAWEQFAAHVRDGAANPTLQFTVRISDGITVRASSCSAQIDQHVAVIRQVVSAGQRSEPNLTVRCRSDEGS